MYTRINLYNVILHSLWFPTKIIVITTTYSLICVLCDVFYKIHFPKKRNLNFDMLTNHIQYLKNSLLMYVIVELLILDAYLIHRISHYSKHIYMEVENCSVIVAHIIEQQFNSTRCSRNFHVNQFLRCCMFV